MRVPSASTISRSLVPIDLLLCIVRRQQMKGKQVFYNIATDSSPQAGVDWQLTHFTAILKMPVLQLNKYCNVAAGARELCLKSLRVRLPQWQL